MQTVLINILNKFLVIRFAVMYQNPNFVLA